MILVDDAIWPWRGDRWAHLVSDHSYAELHEFAVAIGKRRLAFQGDHYDVDVETRRRALRAGAAAVDGRSLVRALRASGLRRRVDPELLHRGPTGWVEGLGHRGVALADAVGDLAVDDVIALAWPEDVVVTAIGRPGADLPPPADVAADEIHRHVVEHRPHVELVFRR